MGAEERDREPTKQLMSRSHIQSFLSRSFRTIMAILQSGWGGGWGGNGGGEARRERKRKKEGKRSSQRDRVQKLETVVSFT